MVNKKAASGTNKRANKRGAARTGKKIGSVSSITEKKSGKSKKDKKVGGGSLFFSTAISTVATAAENTNPPATPQQCLVWRDRDVRQRIRRALSRWSGQTLSNIISTRTLSQLAIGTGIPWNEGNQARLVQAINEENVFTPFHSLMAPPPVLLPGATTVAEWEKVVWRMQAPQTFCYVFGS